MKYFTHHQQRKSTEFNVDGRLGLSCIVRVFLDYIQLTHNYCTIFVRRVDGWWWCRMTHQAVNDVWHFLRAFFLFATTACFPAQDTLYSTVSWAIASASCCAVATPHHFRWKFWENATLEEAPVCCCGLSQQKIAVTALFADSEKKLRHLCEIWIWGEDYLFSQLIYSSRLFGSHFCRQTICLWRELEDQYPDANQQYMKLSTFGRPN